MLTLQCISKWIDLIFLIIFHHFIGVRRYSPATILHIILALMELGWREKPNKTVATSIKFHCLPPKVLRRQLKYKPSHQSQGGRALVGGSSSSRWGVNTMTEHKHASMQHGYIAARGRRGQGIVNLNINTQMPATPPALRSVWKFEQHL